MDKHNIYNNINNIHLEIDSEFPFHAGFKLFSISVLVISGFTHPHTHVHPCVVFFLFVFGRVWWTAGGALWQAIARWSHPHTLWPASRMFWQTDCRRDLCLMHVFTHRGGGREEKYEKNKRRYGKTWRGSIWCSFEKFTLTFSVFIFSFFLFVDSMCLAMRSSHRFSPLGCVPICCAACGCLWCRAHSGGTRCCLALLHCTRGRKCVAHHLSHNWHTQTHTAHPSLSA